MTLATRVIPIVLYDGVQAVKSVRFGRPLRNVGSLTNTARVYAKRNVDEIVFLDVGAHARGGPDLAAVDSFAAEIMGTPFAVGGGVRTVEDARRLLGAGADKVVLCSAALDDPDRVASLSAVAGRQAIVVCVDAARVAVNPTTFSWLVYDHRSGTKTDRPVSEWCRELEAVGAGEILLQSVDQDGTMTGYDYSLVLTASGAVSVPLVAAGGAGRPEDAVAAVEAGASAVAAASMFHFRSCRPADVRQALERHGYVVRRRAL